MNTVFMQDGTNHHTAMHLRVLQLIVKATAGYLQKHNWSGWHQTYLV